MERRRKLIVNHTLYNNNDDTSVEKVSFVIFLTKKILLTPKFTGNILLIIKLYENHTTAPICVYYNIALVHPS